jgi:hypothetical protein
MPPMHQKRQSEETNSFVETFLHRGLTTQSHKVGIRYVQKNQITSTLHDGHIGARDLRF